MTVRTRTPNPRVNPTRETLIAQSRRRGGAWVTQNALSVFGRGLRMPRARFGSLAAITYDVFGSYDRQASICFDKRIFPAESLPVLVENESRG